MIKSQIRYAGYQYDEESDYYNLHARYYDPKTARFLQQDTYTGTIGDPLSLNLYAYCHNEPMMYFDPTGHWEEIELHKDMNANQLLNAILQAKDMWEENQKIIDEAKKTGFFGGIYNFINKKKINDIIAEAKANQEDATGIADDARGMIKQTEAYKTNKHFKDNYEEYYASKYGGTRRQVNDLLDVLARAVVINPDNFKEPNKGTGNALVTVEQLKNFGWANPDQKLADEINAALSMFGVNEGKYATEQIILFMATVGHEAGMGNYNYIQAGVSGPYRGAGAMQLTNKEAYEAFDKYLTKNLKGYNGEIMKSNEPYKVIAEKYAWMSAAWVWSEFKGNKARVDRYMESGYKLYDSFIVTSAFIQGMRGSNDDYKRIAAGQYNPINYSAVYSGKYGTQNTYDVVDIQVINGGTVVSSNNWNDRKAKFEKAYNVYGGK